jgi:hypothetical protein
MHFRFTISIPIPKIKYTHKPTQISLILPKLKTLHNIRVLLWKINFRGLGERNRFTKSLLILKTRKAEIREK